MIPASGDIPIGSRIRAFRWHQGRELADLAAAVGDYEPSHLSHIESGRANASDELLEKVAQALGITIDKLRNTPREQVAAWAAAGAPSERNRQQRKNLRSKAAPPKPHDEAATTEPKRASRLPASPPPGAFGSPIGLAPSARPVPVKVQLHRIRTALADLQVRINTLQELVNTLDIGEEGS